MHRLLKDLLPKARGQSHLVIVVFVDVRGFSAWMSESAEAALFLRSAYTRIMDTYFPEAAFFKPTGDGLLIIIDYDDDNLHKAVQEAVAISVKLVEEFPEITAGDQMVNFETPTDIGIGIARGAATSLVSGERTLDYSGRPLNLAARLMDMARPRGVVFSADLGYELLDNEIADKFDQESVYVRGLAEDQPVQVFFLRGETNIPEVNKRPLKGLVRQTDVDEKVKFRVIQERAPNFLHRLKTEPSDKNDIKVYVSYRVALPSGRPHRSMRKTLIYDAEYYERTGKIYARVNYGSIATDLKKYKVRPTWDTKIAIDYPISPP